MPGIVPNLWFDTQAEEAAEFYCSVFPDSKILSVSHYTDAGPRDAGMVLTVEFSLDGSRFIALNGGPEFRFDEAISFVVECEDQAEVDHYWSALSAGGEEGPCGWLKDRFGLSWQVVPKGFEEIMSSPDPERKTRAMKAILSMTKIDLATVMAAADGSEIPH